MITERLKITPFWPLEYGKGRDSRGCRPGSWLCPESISRCSDSPMLICQGRPGLQMIAEMKDLDSRCCFYHYVRLSGFEYTKTALNLRVADCSNLSIRWRWVRPGKACWCPATAKRWPTAWFTMTSLKKSFAGISQYGSHCGLGFLAGLRQNLHPLSRSRRRSHMIDEVAHEKRTKTRCA